MKLQDAVDAFMRYLRYERGMSEATVQSYSYDLAKLDDFLIRRLKVEQVEVEQVVTRDLQAWVREMAMVDELAPATRSRRISAMRALWRPGFMTLVCCSACMMREPFISPGWPWPSTHVAPPASTPCCHRARTPGTRTLWWAALQAGVASRWPVVSRTGHWAPTPRGLSAFRRLHVVCWGSRPHTGWSL